MLDFGSGLLPESRENRTAKVVSGGRGADFGDGGVALLLVGQLAEQRLQDLKMKIKHNVCLMYFVL